MRMPSLIILLAIGLHPFLPAFAQQQSYEPSFRFYSEVPTDKSNITTIVTVTSSPCDKVESEDFTSAGKNLSLYIKTIPSPNTTISCAAVLVQHEVKQEIGKHDTDLYGAWLYVRIA